MPRLVSCFLLTQKNQGEAEERVWGAQEAKPQPLPSLYPPPLPCACSAALALSAPSFGVILSSSFLCPWGGHVTRPGDTGPQSWPVSPSWPQGLGWGWAHELSWDTAHVRSGTGAGALRKEAPFFPQPAATVDHLVKSRVERRIETDLWKYYLYLPGSSHALKPLPIRLLSYMNR